MTQRIDLGYYPSCVVNLTMRYDESIQVAESVDDLRRAGDSGEFSHRGGGKLGRQFGPRIRVGAISATSWDANGNAQVETFVTDEVIENANGRSLTPLTFGGDRFTVVLDRVPRRGSFTLPHPRQAGTFSMVLDYRDLPIDPRLVRALGVEIHLGCVSAADYAAGMTGAVDDAGRPRSIVRTRADMVDPTTGAPAPADQTLLFYGTADSWEVTHEDTGSVVMIEGRDIRGIFLDGTPPANLLEEVDLTRPIHRVVADMIARIPYDVSLAVDVLTIEGEWPGGVVPSPGDVRGFTRVRLGKSGTAPQAGGGSAGGGGGGAGGGKVSFWDLITNLCNLVGGIPHFQGSTLWIRPARSVFDTALDPSRAPFASPRYDGDGALGLRRLVVGRDVKSLTFRRKFGGVTVPAIETIGFDDRARGRARYPRGNWPPASSTAAAAKNSDEVLRIPVPQVRDPAHLTEIARDLYEEIGRGEIGGRAETKQLASYGGGNADPDMLRLRPTDPIEFAVDNQRPHALASRSFQSEVAEVYQRIGDVDASRAIVAANRGAAVGVLDIFRVTKVEYDWSTDQGVRVGLEFQNYVTPRHQATTDQPPKATGPGRKKRARVKSKGENRKGKAVTSADLPTSSVAAVAAASAEQTAAMSPAERREYQRELDRKIRASEAARKRQREDLRRETIGGRF